MPTTSDLTSLMSSLLAGARLIRSNFDVDPFRYQYDVPINVQSSKVGNKMCSKKLDQDVSKNLNDFVLRAHLTQLGLDIDNVARPRIGIVNSSGGMSVCYAHLDEIAAIVSDAVSNAGGFPVELRTSGPTDGLFFVLGGRNETASAKDVLARDIEMMARGENIAGLVMLSSCDSTTPGHLLAIAHLNLPAVVVPCGFQSGKLHCGRDLHIVDVYEGVGAVAVGRMTLPELADIADNAIGSAGVCAGMGTANTMHMMAEALGMALPGSSPIWAGSSRLRDFARDAGRVAVGLVKAKHDPRTVLTRAAFMNAVAVLLAGGGAATAVHHLQALADKCGIDIDIHDLVRDVGETVKQSFFIAPSGAASMEEMQAMGGTRGIMKTIKSSLDLDAMTISGRLSTVLEESNESLPASHNPSELPGLVLLTGNLAPYGALLRPGTKPSSISEFEGAAHVVRSPIEAQKDLQEGRLLPGSVLVMLGGIDDTACLVAGAGLADEVAIVSNGGFSGLSRGIVAGFMRRGNEENHPIFQVRNGDRIRIDIPARSITWNPSS